MATPDEWMQHTDKARAEFESWCTDADDGPQVDPMWMAHFDPATNEYALDQIQRDWRSWLASRAALVVTIEPGDCFSPNDCGDLAIWRDDAKRLLEAAGVTVRE